MRTTRKQTDTSTLANLREIMEMEAERVIEERARAEARLAEAERLEAERAAKIASEHEAARRAERMRAAALEAEQARRREEANAETRARLLRVELDAAHAARAREHERLLAHERSVLALEVARTQRTRATWFAALAGLGLATSLAWGGFAFVVSPRVARLERENAELRHALTQAERPQPTTDHATGSDAIPALPVKAPSPPGPEAKSAEERAATAPGKASASPSRRPSHPRRVNPQDALPGLDENPSGDPLGGIPAAHGAP